MPYKPAREAHDRTRVRELAERVGFEPTCPLRDKTLSRRPRYDHFGTSPFGRPTHKFTVFASRPKSSAELGLTALLEEVHHQAPTFLLADSGHHLDTMVVSGQRGAFD